MNSDKQKALFEKMLKRCPDILTPQKAAKWSPVGKNTIYAAIKNGSLEACIYKGGYILSKDALIDFLVKTSDESGRNFSRAGAENDK